MLLNVNEQELHTIGKGLSLLPWIEVNDLLMKLSQQQQASKAADQLIRLEASKVVALPNAPYGLKKDGTPAKRRGRPAKKARKVRQ